MTATSSLLIFLQFLRRDFYTRFKRIKDYIINYSIIYPTLHAGTFGYLSAYILFEHPSPQLASIFFAGSSLFILIDITFEVAFELLFDLETDRYIDYQITLLNPRLVIVERILFSTLFTFLLVAPFYGITTLLLYRYLDFSNTAWFQVYAIIFFGCLVCASYQQLAALLVKSSHHVVQYWTRFNIPLMLLGGLWTPYAVIAQYSTVLSYVMLANPLTYITEGLRQALVGGPQFMPFWICAVMLFILSCMFTTITFRVFKRKLDHI